MFDNLIRTNIFEPILIEKALGSWVWDNKGKKYLDCESGMWCVNIGHNHPEIIQVIKHQLDMIIHRNKSFLTPITLETADKLLKYLPGKYDKITFLNSGSEAMEFSINFARKVTKREKILSLQDSYFGAYGKSKESSYTSPVNISLKIPYPVCDSENCNCLAKYKNSIDEVIDGIIDQIACFVFEPVIVSGGVFKPCSKYMQYICNKIQSSGGLIVVDEVTTGMGRTGKRFGFEHLSVNPDVVVLGKALGNGYPISAIVTYSKHEIKCSLSELYYAQSHQLDPLGAAAALGVIKQFESDSIIAESGETSVLLKNFFEELNSDFIEEIRAIGMIFAIQICNYNDKLAKDLVVEIKNRLLEEGVLVGYNTAKELIRFLPPLNINKEEIKFLQEKIEKVFTSIKEERNLL